MKRRVFLGAMSAAAVGGPTFLLNGCGGVGGDSSGGGCASGSFAKGLAPATTQILSGIEPLSELGLTTASSTAATTIGSVGGYVNWSDPQTTSSYGLPFGYIPPISSQGQLGSCVAWGCGYSMTSFVTAMNTNLISQSPQSQASPADLYAKILRREVGNPCGNGTYVNLKTAITPLRSASIEVIFVAQAS